VVDLSQDIPSHRGYDEKEIGELIQRATELHESSSGLSGESSRKLSLDEIEHIATELGISSEHLQAAAAELENRKNTDRQFNFWGGPFVVSESRVVNGDLTEEQWEDIIFELRRFSGRTGTITELGRTRQWSHTVGEDEEGIRFTRTQATIRTRRDHTSIEVQKRFGIVGALYPLVFIASTLLALAVTNAYPTPLASFLSVAGILGSVGAVRFLISNWSKKYSRKISGLADKLGEILASPATQSASSGIADGHSSSVGSLQDPMESRRIADTADLNQSTGISSDLDLDSESESNSDPDKSQQPDRGRTRA